MRHFLFLVTILLITGTVVNAQLRWEDTPQPKFFFEGNIYLGGVGGNLSAADINSAYKSPVNTYASDIKYTDKFMFGVNLTAGYYFNKKRNLGIGTGITFLTQSSSMQMDTFHNEFMALDFESHVFRQSVSSKSGIQESITNTNISIPVFIRYKKPISENLTFTLDAGVLIGLLMQAKSTASGSFDYEAIYKITNNGTANIYSYDNAPIPASTDILFTRAQYALDNPTGGDVNAYFNSLQKVGYSVGLNNKVSKTSTINYKSMSIDASVQASMHYYYNQHITFKGGLYVLTESFSNKSAATTPFTTTPGSYNSFLQYTKTVLNYSYGLVLGVNYSM